MAYGSSSEACGGDEQLLGVLEALLVDPALRSVPEHAGLDDQLLDQQRDRYRLA